jgi:aspartyl-tRNA synthetase
MALANQAVGMVALTHERHLIDKASFVTSRWLAGCRCRYGSDKPDLRYGLEHVDVSASVASCGFKCVMQCARNIFKRSTSCASACSSRPHDNDSASLMCRACVVS